MKGWKVKALADVCQIRPPKAEARRKLSPTDLVSFVPMNDLGDDAMTFEPRETKVLADVEGSYTYFADDDVILAKITPCFENGKLGIARNLKNGVGFGSSEFVVLRPNEGLCAEYLYHFLSRSSFREDGAKRMTGAVGHKRIPKEFVEELQIPLPQLDEQRRIVAILDEAFAGLAAMRQHAEANLRNARALFDSHLNAIFSQRGEGWEIKKLGEVADCCLGKMLDKTKNRGTPMPYLRNINVRWFEFDLADLLEMPFEDHEFDRYSAVSGDVLICEGGYPGRAAIWQSDEPVFFQKAIHRVRFADRDRAQWLVYYLWFLDRSGQLKSHFTGAGIQHFTGQALKRLEIPLPPLDAQSQIVARIVELQAETTRLEALYRRKLAAIDELKQSILHRAFSGALTRDAAPAIAAPTQPANDNRQTTAMVMALAFMRHKRANRDKSFGHVKAQKILHMVEAEAGFDLGRAPRRDAAGPNDFQHMLAAEKWAEETRHFSFTGDGDRYIFKPLANFDDLTKAARAIEPATRGRIERVIDLFIPMDMQQSELFATVYAAWNNLLIEGKPVTDDAIISAAREGWHASKLKIDRAEFIKALRLLRDKNCAPSGQGKLVQPMPQSGMFA